MSALDHKFNLVKQQLIELVEHCHDIDDKTTVQLLHEVQELVDISHQTALGKALKSIKNSFSEPD